MRSRTRARGAQLSPLWGRVLSVFAGGSVFTASRYTVDGVSGKVASYTDWLDGAHTIAQATAANQHAVPAADATLGGNLVATIPNTTAIYTSSRAASAWRYVHDGTGVSEFHVFYVVSATTSYYATTEGGGAGVGGGLGVTTGPVVLIRWRTTAGAGLISQSLGALALNAWGTWRFTYLNGGSPEWALYTNGALGGSGSDGSTPNSGDPNSTMQLFRGTPANTKWFFSGFAPRVFNASDVAMINRYMSGIGLVA